MSDISQQLQSRVERAYREKTPLVIQGGDSKSFYGNPCDGEPLSVGEHKGIVEYEPKELVVTVRAGTPLQELKQILADEGQMLAFEPPAFGDGATIGGTIACGFSGPRRPFAGSARDFMLGCKVLTGKGEVIDFGGKVIKNVAGYDVSRLMTGALGTLGVLLEVSLKVLPVPEVEMTLVMPSHVNESLDVMNARAGQPVPLTAACYDGEAVLMRLSGTESGIKDARRKIAGDELKMGADFWRQLNEQEHFFFGDDMPLWRLSLAPAALHLGIPGSWLFDWGGALRWLKTDLPPSDVRDAVAAEGGHATLFRHREYWGQESCNVFHPLPAPLMSIHQKLKHAFDPEKILNRHRFYEDVV
ncbi:MAG: glycolate oxidase subunit GlcE [Gammaproteobacteria bacterium]